MRRISLDQLTVIGVTPPELVDIAASLGYELVGPILEVGADFPLPVVSLRRGDPQTRALADRLKATGVAIGNMDGFILLPATNVGELRPKLELSAELGARNVVTLAFDPDQDRCFDNFCRLCEAARESDLGVALEFYARSFVPSLDAALQWVRRSRMGNTGVLIDALHFNQSGGTPADIRAADAALIRSAQICDGPLAPSMDEYARNALYERQVPGEGKLPLVEFIAALPPHLPIGVEVPMTSLAERGVPPLERARRCLEATRALVARAALIES